MRLWLVQDDLISNLVGFVVIGRLCNVVTFLALVTSSETLRPILL